MTDNLKANGHRTLKVLFSELFPLIRVEMGWEQATADKGTQIFVDLNSGLTPA